MNLKNAYRHMNLTLKELSTILLVSTHFVSIISTNQIIDFLYMVSSGLQPVVILLSIIMLSIFCVIDELYDL